METQEIVKLTRERIAELMRSREQCEEPALFEGSDRRDSPPRWPFAGVVELSSAAGNSRTRWFTTCLDLGLGGLGLMADQYLPPGMVLDFACHLPEITLYGRGTVKHCTGTGQGYMVGLEFIFDD